MRGRQHLTLSPTIERLDTNSTNSRNSSPSARNSNPSYFESARLSYQAIDVDTIDSLYKELRFAKEIEIDG